MNLEEYKGVFVFAQQVDNELTPIAFELIGKGKDLSLIHIQMCIRDSRRDTSGEKSTGTWFRTDPYRSGYRV